MYIFVITQVSEELAQTMHDQLLWSEVVQFCGARLELVKVTEPGKPLAWRLILKIPLPSGGVDTRAKKMLLLMNLEELSTYRIFYDGWTSIQSVWKLKDRPYLLKQRRSISPQTFTPEVGIPTLMRRRTKRWSEDFE